MFILQSRCPWRLHLTGETKSYNSLKETTLSIDLFQIPPLLFFFFLRSYNPAQNYSGKSQWEWRNFDVAVLLFRGKNIKGAKQRGVHYSKRSAIHFSSTVQELIKLLIIPHQCCSYNSLRIWVSWTLLKRRKYDFPNMPLYRLYKENTFWNVEVLFC